MLTLTLLAIPTVAVCVLGPTTLVLRWLVARLMIGFSTAAGSNSPADNGGERICCKFWRGDGISRGALDGCEDSAEAAVTRGCLREGERSREVERLAEAEADADLGLGIISQVGSCDSTCAFHAFASAGTARPATIVTDSLSEVSKL